jgi:hypothetical protein
MAAIPEATFADSPARFTVFIVIAARPLSLHRPPKLESLPEPTQPQPGNNPERRAHRLKQIIGALDRLDHDSGVFVLCFSDIRDSLSQWRAYGGYAIGFEASALSQLTYTQPPLEEGALAERQSGLATRTFELKRTQYGLDEATADLLVKLASDLDNALGGVGVGLRGIAELHAKVLPHLAVVKHPSFASESEWRLVTGSWIWKGIAPFRVGRLALIPYLPVRFEKAAIAEIVVGPSPERGLRKAGVRQLLESFKFKVDSRTDVHGFGEGVRVTGTSSPARL